MTVRKYVDEGSYLVRRNTPTVNYASVCYLILVGIGRGNFNHQKEYNYFIISKSIVKIKLKYIFVVNLLFIYDKVIFDTVFTLVKCRYHFYEHSCLRSVYINLFRRQYPDFAHVERSMRRHRLGA